MDCHDLRWILVYYLAIMYSRPRLSYSSTFCLTEEKIALMYNPLNDPLFLNTIKYLRRVNCWTTKSRLVIVNEMFKLFLLSCERKNNQRQSYYWHVNLFRNVFVQNSQTSWRKWHNEATFLCSKFSHLSMLWLQILMQYILRFPKYSLLS